MTRTVTMNHDTKPLLSNHSGDDSWILQCTHLKTEQQTENEYKLTAKALPATQFLTKHTF